MCARGVVVRGAEGGLMPRPMRGRCLECGAANLVLAARLLSTGLRPRLVLPYRSPCSPVWIR